MTGGDGSLEKLAGQTGQKQGNAEFLSVLQNEASVLVHPLDTEVGGKVPSEDERVLETDEPALGGAIVQNLKHERGVHAALGGEDHAFVEGHQDIGEDEVLSEFGLESQAGTAAEINLLAHGVEEGADQIGRSAA